ncbi:hypothetical protein HYT32_01500 [Candidatus Roizmanbacteria bacterium]|nr:hypothetical protein [Candidatus Roizmanbacteria bacterium]
MFKETPYENPIHNKDSSINGITRREFLKRSGMLLLAGVLAINGGVSCSDEKGREKFTESESFDLDMKLIAEEVKRLGSTPNKAEQEMWNKAYQRTRQTVPVTEETLRLVGTYLRQTIENMGSSKNEYLSHAADVILQQSQMQLLRISIDGFIRLEESELFAVVRTEIENNKIQFVLHIDGSQVLNNSNGLTFALALSHEAQHLEERFKYQDSLARNLSLQERIEKQNQKRQSDPVSDETGAYAIQSEAILETFRLGVESELPSDVVHVAAMYIRAGKNKDSQVWKSYIESRLGLKN